MVVQETPMEEERPTAQPDATTEADEIPAELEAMAEPSPEDAPLRDIGTAVETEKTAP